MKSVDEIVKLKKEVEQDLLKIPGVFAVAVGNKLKDGKKQDEVAIRVYVKKKRSKGEIPESEHIPEKIKDVSTDVIEREQHIISHGQPDVDKTFHNIMIGGINVGPREMTGTLGAIALDNSTGEAVMLSCAHVLAPSITSWTPGASINNPADNTGHVVGFLKKVETNGMDAAIATIKDPNGYTCRMVDSRIGPITGSRTDVEVHNMLNGHVKKIGVRTGFTTGIIESVNAPVTVTYNNGQITNDLSEQIEIQPDSGSVFSEEGDSGACIVDDSGKIVGLLVGGVGRSSYATPIERVLKQLDISICPS